MSPSTPPWGEAVKSFPPQGGAQSDCEAPFHKAQSSDVEAPLGSKLLSSTSFLQAEDGSRSENCKAEAASSKLHKTDHCEHCCWLKASKKLLLLFAGKLSSEALLLQSSHGLKLPKARASSSFKFSGKFPAPLCKLLSLPSSLPEVCEAEAVGASGSSGSQAAKKASASFCSISCSTF